MKWIKCRNRLPDGEYVAFTWNGEKIETQYGFDRTYQIWETESEMGYVIPTKKPITHWMKYPNPPEE